MQSEIAESYSGQSYHHAVQLVKNVDVLASEKRFDKAAMSAQFIEQLNKVLETKDSARGLLISVSDVVFQYGQVFVESRSAREAGEGC